MLRARNFQRIRKHIDGPGRSSAVIALGVTASLLFSIYSHPESRDSTPGQRQLKLAQLDVHNSIAPFRVPMLEYILKPTFVQCNSLFERWRRPKSTLDSVRDNRRLKNAYLVEWDNPLGEGGFGAVYLATDKQSNEKVALKKISKEYTNDAGFQREMSALLAIRKAGGHPNVLQFRETFNEGRHFYLTLDYISGGEMFDHLINSGPYSEADAARLMREVASALSFLHGIGMVHGDLKPENLMLSTPNRFDSVVKVIDFGTAQILDEKGIPTLSNAGVGTTPAFCPPEVLQPNREDPKRKPSMDMWALGIILYTMLVGVHPFDLRGDATNELIAYRVVHRKDPPLRGSSFTRHLSDSSIDLIEKLLSWDEETRLTADDMLKHPWICGLTASRSKIEGSDNKLSKLRPIKSRLEAKVFRDFMSWADEGEQGKEASGMSLFERSFRNFDTSSKGFLTAGDVGKELNEKVDDDEALSLSAFSTLLSENMQNHFFKKSEVIFKEGDEGKEMYFLNSGIVEVKTEDGFRTTLKAGDFVGEAALLNEMKRSGTVTCITPVHAIKITKENFAKYLSASDSTLSLQMLETTKSREASRKLFNGFSDLLSESMKNKSFKQGDIIYHEGDKGNNMFFIKSGTVTVNNKEGFRTTLKQGDFVGEGSLLSNKPRSSTVTCLTPVEGMMIQRAYFEKYIVSSGKDLRLKVYRENKSRDLARVRGILRQQKHLRPITFCEGDFLFKEGEVTKNMYIAVDGEFDIKAGDLSVLRIKKGNICGMHSLVFESPRKLSARCATKKCSVVEIGPRTFRGLLESSSSLKDSIVDTCRQREFRRAVVFHTKQTFPKTEKELLEAFKCVQYGHSGKAIMLKDVHRLLRNANPEISDTEVREVFQSIDLGGNGSINFEMFKVLFLE